MAGLSLTLALRIAAILTGSQDLAANASELLEKWEKVFTSGVGADQCDKIFTDTRSLADGASESLDLAGSLADGVGGTLTFARVKLIAIRNLSTTQVLAVGGAASNQFINWVANASDIVNIRPGGILLLVAPDATGYAVTADTGDLLKVANGSAGQTTQYEIIIAGGAT